MTEKDFLDRERRKYIRLDSVFPVGFRFLSVDGAASLSDRLQGFTSNVSSGGLCLEIYDLKPQLAGLLREKKAKISLDIEMPLTGNPTAALAEIAWVKQLDDKPDRYLVGLNYQKIDSRQNSRIMRYARFKKSFVPAVSSIIVVLGISFALGTYLNIKLIQGNKALVEQLVKIVQESSVAKQKIKEISKQKDDLQVKIHGLELQLGLAEEEKAALGKKIKSKENSIARKVKELNGLIEKLKQEKSVSQGQLIAVQQKEDDITEDLLRLNKKKATLEKANLDKMYAWLKIHQNPRTGLVASFEGDRGIANWAFIYDQALAIQAYTEFSDFERARKLLDFFKKQSHNTKGLFINAYYANDTAPAEFTIHSGPNIWVGLAIMQYTHKTEDKSYLGVVENIARAIISLQDKDGGIRGGPEVEWYSTEHNLDAYAFFNMLHKVTGKAQYQIVRDKVLSWLASHTYDKADIPIKRGKGDATIATDTYAWSIAAVGPQKLEEIGMNPDRIIEFAEDNCRVEVDYQRPQGQLVKVKGFDFAAAANIGRGGVVSSEWTAQMVLAFKIMADFYHQKKMIAKARAYEVKADEYLAELSNMVISSPSSSGQGESCLPYATQDDVDTGHGWRTPKGRSTGCVAGTAYTLFAYYDYNPLQFQE